MELPVLRTSLSSKLLLAFAASLLAGPGSINGWQIRDLERSSLADLRALEPPRVLATHALRQLPPRDYPERMIRRMISHSDIHEWGSANTLQEFAKHPLVAKAGQHVGLAAEAANAAVGSPTGTRAGFRVYRLGAASFGPAESADPRTSRSRAQNDAHHHIYMEIFEPVRFLDLPRAEQMSAFMLDDQRVFSAQMRYCDLAGGSLQSVAKEQFGFTVWNQPLAERDRALENAIRWTKHRGLK